MCGRYFRRADKQRIADAFRAWIPPTMELLPSYNIAPSSMQPVIVEHRDTAERIVRLMRWGLIPSWCEDPTKLGLSTINAKAESLMEKTMWRGPFTRRRCLVPADGYYEWQKVDARNRQPWAFGLKSGEPLALAGLWERWRPREPGAAAVESFSIVTTEANELAAGIHTRMPAILQPRDYDRWLRREDGGRPPVDLLRPLDASLMSAWKVSTAVGNTRNDTPNLLDALSA